MPSSNKVRISFAGRLIKPYGREFFSGQNIGRRRFSPPRGFIHTTSTVALSPVHRTSATIPVSRHSRNRIMCSTVTCEETRQVLRALVESAPPHARRVSRCNYVRGSHPSSREKRERSPSRVVAHAGRTHDRRMRADRCRRSARRLPLRATGRHRHRQSP